MMIDRRDEARKRLAETEQRIEDAWRRRAVSRSHLEKDQLGLLLWNLNVDAMVYRKFADGTNTTADKWPTPARAGKVPTEQEAA